MEGKYLKMTRHNGRSGKNVIYNPLHNDQRFDVENSEYVDTERAERNIYWDCYWSFTTAENKGDTLVPDFSFEQIEKAFYVEHYSDHVDA